MDSSASKNTAVDNIVLIGMPGSGKSTLGRRLAQARGMRFIDTDQLIEQQENMSIQAVVNRRGLKAMRRAEERVLTGLLSNNSVIATGGSAVFSRAAMQHLQTLGPRVYLKISLATLMRRVNNTSSRGLVKLPGSPLPRLYAERVGLYEQAADVVFENNWPLTSMSLERLTEQIEALRDD